MTDEPKDPMLKLTVKIEEARDIGDAARAAELENNLYALAFERYQGILKARQDMADLSDSTHPDAKAAGARWHDGLDVMAKKFGEALRKYDDTVRLLNRRREK